MAKSTATPAAPSRSAWSRACAARQARHRLSVKALGLNKLNDVRELKDSPQVRGLINQVHYLVRVEE